MHAYDLVSETIRKQIKLGKYQPGMKLPKEIELADRMGFRAKLCERLWRNWKPPD